MRHLNRPIPGCDDRYLHERCLVAPSPDAQARLKEKLREAASGAGLSVGQVGLVPLDRGGFNDGLIKPGTELPLGMALTRLASAVRPGGRTRATTGPGS